MDGEEILSGGGGGGDVIEEGDVSVDVMEKGSYSPLTGSYLLIVLAEPHSEEDREIILERLNKGLLSWDVDSSHVDLNCELLNLANSSPEGDEARNGEKLVQWASENLVVEVLIHSQVNTLQQCMKNLLASFTRHRHIIHSGYTFQGSGSWVLQDGTFSLNDYLELWGEGDVQRILSAYKGDISVAVHCASENGWTQERLSKEPFAKMCQIHMNPSRSEKMSQVHNAGVTSFIEYISKLLTPSPLKEILEPSDIVGNIRFSHPTLYVFPGGQGDAALFGINGFNMLIDGGFSRRSCFWDFTRHLDRLDAVLLTRVNNNSVGGLSSVIQRKVMNQVYPQIGHFFGNVMERKCTSGGGGGGGIDKDKEKEKGGGDMEHGEKLLVSLTDEGQRMLDNLRNINLKPHLCFRETHIEPINLYHKVGHGKLDLYILNPAKDSREVKEFLSKWNSDCKSFVSSRISLRQQQQQQAQQDGKDFQYPVLNLVSICALLVWQPANPRDPITRILFPGSTPQHKIFEALQKLKHLEFLKYPVCSAKTIAASNKSKVKSEKVISEAKQQLSKVSSHANVMASSLQPSSTEGSLSRAAATTGPTPPVSRTTVTTTTHPTSGKSGEEKEKERERVARTRSKIGIPDSNKAQGKTESPAPPAKRQPRSTSKGGVVGLGKTPSATRVSSKGASSTRRSLDTDKISSSSLPKKVSPTSPAKKSLETTASKIGHGLKSSSLSKGGLPGVGGKGGSSLDTTGATPPPSTPPKSAKESANNRRVIEYKSHLTKSNIKTDTSHHKGTSLKSGGEIKKRTSSSSTIGKSSSAAPKSPPTQPVPVKRSHRTGGMVTKEIIGTTAAGAAVIAGVIAGGMGEKKKEISPSSQDTSAPLKIPEDLGEEEETKIQAETNGSIISREENGVEGEEEDGDKSQQQPEGEQEELQGEQEGEPTSIPLLATFLPTESGSELSSLDHMDVYQQDQPPAVISSDLSVGGDEQQQFDSLTIQDDGVVESEQDEEDEYLIVEKDESSNADNVLDNSERISDQFSKVAVGSLDEIPTVPGTDDVEEMTGESPQKDSADRKGGDEEKDSEICSAVEQQQPESVECQEQEEKDSIMKEDDDDEKADGTLTTLKKVLSDADARAEELVETDVVEKDVDVDSSSETKKEIVGKDEKEYNLDTVINDEDKEKEEIGQGKEEIFAKSLAEELKSMEDSLVAKECVDDKEQGIQSPILQREEEEEGLQSIVECSSVKNALERESNILELKESVTELEVVRKGEEETEFSLTKDVRDDDIHQSIVVQEDDEVCEKVGEDESKNIVKKNDFSTANSTSPSPAPIEEFHGNNLAFQEEPDKVEEVVVHVGTEEVEEIEEKDMHFPPTSQSSPSPHILRETLGKVDLVHVEEENREDVTPPGLKDVASDATSLVAQQKVERLEKREGEDQVVQGEKSPYDAHQELTQQEPSTFFEGNERQEELKVKSLKVQKEDEEKDDGTKQEIKDLKGQAHDEIGEEKLDHISPPSSASNVQDDVITKDKNEIEMTTLDQGDAVPSQVGERVESHSRQEKDQDGNDNKTDVAVIEQQDDDAVSVVLLKEDSEESEKSSTLRKESMKDSSEQITKQHDSTFTPLEPEVTTEVMEKDGILDTVQGLPTPQKSEEKVEDETDSTAQTTTKQGKEEKIAKSGDATNKDFTDEAEKYDEEKVDHPPQVLSPQLDKEKEIRELLTEDQKDVGQSELNGTGGTKEEVENDAVMKENKMLLNQDEQGSDGGAIDEKEDKASEKLAEVLQEDHDKFEATTSELVASRKESIEKLETNNKEPVSQEILNVEQQSKVISAKEETKKEGESFVVAIENKEDTVKLQAEPEKGETEEASELEVSEGLGEDKFIRPLPYEETLNSEGAVNKILQMKDTRTGIEGKSSLIDNEKGGEGIEKKTDRQKDDAGKEGVGGDRGVASAIPKLPRESREVIRTPDEVAELPMHEEVEPGTYETDEVLDEHEAEEFSEEDPGVEAIGISNLPSVLTSSAHQQKPSQKTTSSEKCMEGDVEGPSSFAAGEPEKIDKINISHEPTPGLTHAADFPTPASLNDEAVEELATTKEVQKVGHVHQEIILPSSSSFEGGGQGGEVQKCDAAISPVLESLLGESPPKIFPGQKVEVDILSSTRDVHQIDDQNKEENGNIVQQYSIITPSKGIDHTVTSPPDEDTGIAERGEDNDENQSLPLGSDTKSAEDDGEAQIDMGREENKKTDRKLTIDRDKEGDEELAGLGMKPMTSVVITPSTPPVHKELEREEFSYLPDEKQTEPELESGVGSLQGKETDETQREVRGESGEGALKINDQVKLEPVEETVEKSKSSITSVTTKSAALLTGGEPERKLSDNSDESSTSSATPLTIFSTVSSAPAVEEKATTEITEKTSTHDPVEDETCIESSDTMPEKTISDWGDKEGKKEMEIEDEGRVEKVTVTHLPESIQVLEKVSVKDEEEEEEEEDEQENEFEERNAGVVREGIVVEGDDVEKLFLLPGKDDGDNKSDVDDDDIYETDEPPTLGTMSVSSGLLTAATTLTSAVISQSPEDLATIPSFIESETMESTTTTTMSNTTTSIVTTSLQGESGGGEGVASNDEGEKSSNICHESQIEDKTAESTPTVPLSPSSKSTHDDPSDEKLSRDNLDLQSGAVSSTDKVIDSKKRSSLNSGSVVDVVDGSIREGCSVEEIVDETEGRCITSSTPVELANKLLLAEQNEIEKQQQMDSEDGNGERPEKNIHENIESSPPPPSFSTTDLEEEKDEKRDVEKPIVHPDTTTATNKMSSSALPSAESLGPEKESLEATTQENQKDVSPGQKEEREGRRKSSTTVQCDDDEESSREMGVQIKEGETKEVDQGLDIDKQFKGFDASAVVTSDIPTSTEASVNSAIEKGLSTTPTSVELVEKERQEEAISEINVIKGDKSSEKVDRDGECPGLSDDGRISPTAASAVKRESKGSITPENEEVASGDGETGSPVINSEVKVDNEETKQQQEEEEERIDSFTTKTPAGQDDNISQVSEAEQVVKNVIEAADRKVEEETKVAEKILLQVEEKLMAVTTSSGTSLTTTFTTTSLTPSVILDKECGEKCDKEKVFSETEEVREIFEEKLSPTTTLKSSTESLEKSSTLAAAAVDEVMVGVDVVPSAKRASKDEKGDKEKSTGMEVNNLLSEGVAEEKKEIYAEAEPVSSSQEKKEEECVEEKNSEKSVFSTQTKPPPSASLLDTSGNASAVETNGEEPYQTQTVLTSQFNLEQSEQNKSIPQDSHSQTSACTSSASQLDEEPQSMEISRDAPGKDSTPFHESQEKEKGQGEGGKEDEEILQSLVTHGSARVQAEISKASQDSQVNDSLSSQDKSVDSRGEKGEEYSKVISETAVVHAFPDSQEIQISSFPSSITESSGDGDNILTKENLDFSKSPPTHSPPSPSQVPGSLSEKSSTESIVTSARLTMETSGISKSTTSFEEGTTEVMGDEIEESTDSLEKQMSLIFQEPKASSSSSSQKDDSEKEQGNKMSPDLDNLRQLEIEKKIWSKEMDSVSQSTSSSEDKKSSILESSTFSVVDPTSSSFSSSTATRKSVEERLLEAEDLSMSIKEETSHSSICHTIGATTTTTTSQLINLAEKSNIEKESSSSTTTTHISSSTENGERKQSDFIAIEKDEEIKQQESSSFSVVSKTEDFESQELRKLSGEFLMTEDKKIDGECLQKSSSLSSEQSEEKSESKKSDLIIKKTDGGSRTTITRRFSSQEMEGVMEPDKSFERRRASEICEEISGTSLSGGSSTTGHTGTYPSTTEAGVAKQFVEIERDNEMVSSRTSPGGSFYGGYGYVFGSAADEEAEENPEDEESVHGGEDSQSHSLSTRDSNQSIIISSDFIPPSTVTTSTTTTQSHLPDDSSQKDTPLMSGKDVDEEKSQPEQLLHFDTTGTVTKTTSTVTGATPTTKGEEEKGEFIFGESKSTTSHLTMSYDLMDEGSYSSGDFSDSQLSTVAGRETSGLDDDNVHNYGYSATTGYGQEEEEEVEMDPRKLPASSSQDLENGNLPYTTMTTTSVGEGTPSLTTTMSSATILHTFETSNNGNTTTSCSTTTTSTIKIEGGEEGSTMSVTGTTTSSSTAAPTPSSSLTRQKESEGGEDIVKTWGKPLGLPPIQADDQQQQQPPSSNIHETTQSTGTPKKDKSVDRKNPATPGKTSHGLSGTSRGRSHHRSTKNISPIYVDLAYVPHHGNSNYCDSEFFRLIRSRYYVFSGLEPSRQVFEGLLQGKQSWEDKNLEVTIIPTYDTDTLGYWVVDSEDSLSDARIDLAPSAARCTINLQDHETSCSAYRLEF